MRAIPPILETRRFLQENATAIQTAFEAAAPAFETLRRWLLERYPSNWPPGPGEAHFTLSAAKQIVENEGIPLSYIPRAEVVSELTHAADRSARDAILVARCAEIMEDCEESLHRQLDLAVADQRELLLDAIRALKNGHHRPAQSLSVDVCTTVIEAHINAKHNKAKNECQVNDLDEALKEDRLRYVLGVAPVVNLMTDWSPKSGKPRPVPLSRHVCAHQAHTDHFTLENAIVAVMVATSLIRSLDERYSWPDSNTSP